MMIWSELNAKTSMSVRCCTHTMAFLYELAVWSQSACCYMPLAELSTCLNIHMVHPPFTFLYQPHVYSAHFQFQPHMHTSQPSTGHINLFTANSASTQLFSGSTHYSFSNMLSTLCTLQSMLYMHKKYANV